MKFELGFFLIFASVMVCSCQQRDEKRILEKELRLNDQSAEEIRKQTDSLLREIDSIRKLLDSSIEESNSENSHD